MNLRHYLTQFGLTKPQIHRIVSNLSAGRTIRTTHSPGIKAIYPSNNGYTIVEINSNGQEQEKEFELL
jgi:hypothetical protein